MKGIDLRLAVAPSDANGEDGHELARRYLDLSVGRQRLAPSYLRKQVELASSTSSAACAVQVTKVLESARREVERRLDVMADLDLDPDLGVPSSYWVGELAALRTELHESLRLLRSATPCAQEVSELLQTCDAANCAAFEAPHDTDRVEKAKRKRRRVERKDLARTASIDQVVRRIAGLEDELAQLVKSVDKKSFSEIGEKIKAGEAEATRLIEARREDAATLRHLERTMSRLEKQAQVCRCLIDEVDVDCALSIGMLRVGVADHRVLLDSRLVELHRRKGVVSAFLDHEKKQQKKRKKKSKKKGDGDAEALERERRSLKNRIAAIKEAKKQLRSWEKRMKTEEDSWREAAETLETTLGRLEELSGGGSTPRNEQT